MSIQLAAPADVITIASGGATGAVKRVTGPPTGSPGFGKLRVYLTKSVAVLSTDALYIDVMPAESDTTHPMPIPDDDNLHSARNLLADFVGYTVIPIILEMTLSEFMRYRFVGTNTQTFTVTIFDIEV